jgi:hypothetical protein
MPRSVRTISVNLTAGTASFFRDLDQASGKVREFGNNVRSMGQHSVTDVQATSGALRVLEGNMTNNLRAAERFLANVVGLGPALRVAFPVVGAIALLGVVSELGKKAYELFRNISDASEKASGAFRGLIAPLRLTNDELSVANDRLANEIAKLEGRRENTLKLALDEARVAADKLADSLDRDLANVHKVLEEQNVSIWRRILGVAGTSDIAKEIGGETGFGGFRASIADKTGDALKSAYQQEIAKFEQWIREAQAAQAKREADQQPVIYEGAYYGGGAQGKDQKSRIEELQAVLRQLQHEMAGIALQATNATLGQRRDQLLAARENAAQDRPFEDRMRALGAQTEALRAKFAAVGQDETGQMIAKAFGDAQKAIEETNKALERHNRQLTEAQKNRIVAAAETNAAIEAETAWREKYTQATRAIDQRIESTNLLTAAIGKGYEATRAAAVESRVLQETGERYYAPGDQGVIAGLRQRYQAEFDAEHNRQVAESLDKLQTQIELERALAAAQAQGAQAVREAALAARVRELAEQGATAAQIAAEKELSEAQRANLNAESLAKLNERIAATQRLTAAILQGAGAERAARLENQAEEARRAGATPEQLDALRREAAENYAQSVAEAAVKADRVRSLGEEIQRLHDAKALFGDTLAIEIQLRDLENQRLQALTQDTLRLGTVAAGFRAFFIEMQESAKNASQIVYESLNGALDRASANLGRLFSGQRTDWARSFQELGGEMMQSSIKSLAQTGLGKLGHAFGIDVGGGKPDGTASNPIWVRMAGAGAGIPGAPGFHLPGGLFGGGSQGGGIFSFLGKLFGSGAGAASDAGSSTVEIPFFGGGMAYGGDVYPGETYLVGERGEPELFAPGSRGSITPLSKAGSTVIYQVDARGADLGAENRIRRGIEASYRASVSGGLAASHEREMRTPRK